MGQVFMQFLWLGCISFGGPAAHIGYFQRTFVQRLGWLNQGEFAQLLALCQLLPGPASSQLGFAIGRHRAGIGGALCVSQGQISWNFCSPTGWEPPPGSGLPSSVSSPR